MNVSFVVQNGMAFKKEAVREWNQRNNDLNFYDSQGHMKRHGLDLGWSVSVPGEEVQ